MLIGRREHIEDATASGHLSASLDEIDRRTGSASPMPMMIGCATARIEATTTSIGPMSGSVASG
jgi:hypothetical protein